MFEITLLVSSNEHINVKLPTIPRNGDMIVLFEGHFRVSSGAYFYVSGKKDGKTLDGIAVKVIQES